MLRLTTRKASAAIGIALSSSLSWGLSFSSCCRLNKANSASGTSWANFLGSVSSKVLRSISFQDTSLSSAMKPLFSRCAHSDCVFSCSDSIRKFVSVCLDDSRPVQLMRNFPGHDDASETRAVNPPAHQMIFSLLPQKSLRVGRERTRSPRPEIPSCVVVSPRLGR